MMSHEEELRVVQWQRNFVNTKQPLLASSSGAQVSNIAIKNLTRAPIVLCSKCCSKCLDFQKVLTDLGSGHLLLLH